MNKENKEGRNLEEINQKNVLNFGNLSGRQYNRAIARGLKGVGGDEAGIKCRRCSNRRKAKGKSGIGWDINDNAGEDYGKVYLFKSQVEKIGAGYQITGAIEFYCSQCDGRHNYGEK